MGFIQAALLSFLGLLPTELLSISLKEGAMKLEENFSLSEFRCKDGTEVPDELLDNVRLLAKNLQVLRDERKVQVCRGHVVGADLRVLEVHDGHSELDLRALVGYVPAIRATAWDPLRSDCQGPLQHP